MKPGAQNFATTAGPGWRHDIQALRGWAVVAVILFHAHLGIAPSGYLGVDIFFVVSGFLIGGIVARGIPAGTFGFGRFYLRRIRRLMPAVMMVLLVTTVAATLLLTVEEYTRFWQQLVGALTFSTNIMLWQQINYFNDSAGSEPLLHLWSLAIEEQFYLLFPLALLVLPRRHWLGGLLLATLGSAAFYVWRYPFSPGAVFYLLPTRAWEIGLGTIAALLADDPGLRLRAKRLRPVALCAILLLPLCDPPALSAYLLAIPACLATFALLLAEPAERFRRALQPVVRAGDMSYSLYLVHWPLFAFAHVLYLGVPVPLALNLLLVAVIPLLALALYRFVEEPCRRAAITPRRAWMLALIASLVVAGLGYGGLRLRRALAPPLDLRGVSGLGLPGCDGNTKDFTGFCAQSPHPQMLIWGDSFSQQIVPAIQASSHRPLAEASQPGCAPLLDLGPVDVEASVHWAQTCIAYSDRVLQYLASQPSIRVVLLSGRYMRYHMEGTQALTRAPDGRLSLSQATIAQVVAAQRRTTGAIRQLGKRVVVMDGLPQTRFNIAECWERRLGGLPLVDPTNACAPTPSAMDPAWPWSRALLDRFPTQAATPVIRIEDTFCPHGHCVSIWNGTVLYRDEAHLSHAGSILLGRRLDLGERVWRDAR